MDKEKTLRIPEIILKELNQEATSEELKTLVEWLSQSEKNREFYKRFKHRGNLYALISDHNKIDKTQAWGNINNRINKKEKKVIRPIILSTLKYAAIFLAPLLLATYMLFLRNTQPDTELLFSNLVEQIDNLDESSLIMADGTVVDLSVPMAEGTIIEICGTQIKKGESEILYSNSKSDSQKEIQYNTLITPKSKVFNVTLADGTKVWVNASSAIKYPTQFLSDNRTVFLTGEAYFEVTEDSSKPFIVSTPDMDVVVFGTSFNVMAYPNDNTVEATLVDGAVRVKASKNDIMLEPGKQAKFNRTSKQVEELQVNTELYTSWKSGKYIFEYENFENVMQKLSRWYNLDIAYTDSNKSNLHFSGTLYKYNDIRQTLNIIELATNVKFEVSENTILVSDN